MLARVQTRVEWVDPPVRLPPLLITTHLGADGNAQARFLVPAVDQPGADDAYRLRSAELTGRVRYAPVSGAVAVEFDIPAIELITPAGPLVRVTDATLRSDLHRWTGGLYTGSTHLQIGTARLGVDGARPVPASLTQESPWERPPVATPAAGQVLEGLSIDVTQTPRGRTLDFQLIARAETLRLGGRDYRAAQLGVAAESLDGEPLAEVITALQALASAGRTQALRGLIGLTLVTRTLPRLLAAGPKIALDPLRIDTPDGPVHLRLAIGTPKPGTGSPHPALDAVGWLTAVAGDGDLDLPESIALDWLARSGQGTPAAARQRLNGWLDDGWVSARDGRLSSTVRLADGVFSINGKTLPLLGSTPPGDW